MPNIPADIADGAAKFIEPFEGFSANPYPDPVSGGEPYTIGYGSTKDMNGNPVTLSTPPVTPAAASLLLMRDLHSAILTIANSVKVPLTTVEWIALSSFVYNVGAGNFASSTLLKLLNYGNYYAAAQQFQCWDLHNGKIISGLLRRRLAEASEFEGKDAET